MDKGEPADHGGIFGQAQPDVRERLWGSVGHEAGRGFGGVRHETGAAGYENHEHVECRARLAQHTDGEERAPDRTDDGMNAVPGGIDPWNFVGEKFENVKRARDPDNQRVAEHLERMIGGREDNPVLMNCGTGGENRQIKINACKAGETERDPEQLELVHEKNYASRPPFVTSVCRSSASLRLAIDSDTSETLMLDSAPCLTFA